MLFNKFFQSVYLAVVFASLASASPSARSVIPRHETHRILGRGLQVEAYHPVSDFETFGEGIDAPVIASSVARADRRKATAEAFVASRLNIDAKTVSYRTGYAAETVEHAYIKQIHEGIPFANALANVALKGNKIVSFGSSFVKPTTIAASKPTFDLAKAITVAEEAIGAKYNNHPATLEYVVLEDGSAALTHVIQVQDEDEANYAWFEVFVDAHDGTIRTLTDFVADASYRVLPITKIDIPAGLELLVNPQDTTASPFGWHGTTATNAGTTTAGNNVIAYVGTQTAVTTQSATGLVFDYTYNPASAPSVAVNVNAARTNAFYLMNTIHDVTYRYGFTEAAYNFQVSNNGKGGAANDRVLMSVQDSGGTNNANFATPADGQSGTCRMYIWTLTTIRRDGSMENDIPIHEMTHGVTNRMTGGGTGRCLQTTEAGGMGEGWSDALADWFQAKSTFSNFVLGAYVTNDAGGIRTYPYSTSATTNPLRYSSIRTLNEVHAIGEVWANMLHNVLASLITTYGFSTTAKTNPTGTEGNIVWLHLLIDALALQPCNPTLVTARNAWIQADANRYGGANRCLLWRAFASRGLGMAAASYVDSTTIPSDC